MRELLGVHLPSRVRGRAALLRRLRALLVAVHRFGGHRASTHDDQRWAALVIDALTATVDVADPAGRRGGGGAS
jgi:hypothetical protein